MNGILFSIIKPFLPKPVKVILAEIERAVKKDDDGIVRITVDEGAAIGAVAVEEFCKWKGWPTEFVIPQGDD